MRLEIDITADGCWLWQRGRSGEGYGVLYPDGRTPTYAHRFAYEAAYGPIPEGLTLDHTCRTPNCIRASHLEAVPHIVNVQRGRAQKHPVVVAAANRNCIRGHWMDEANTYTDSRGHTRCRKCHADRKRERAENLVSA